MRRQLWSTKTIPHDDINWMAAHVRTREG
jgi:myosin heavy subunit